MLFACSRSVSHSSVDDARVHKTQVLKTFKKVVEFLSPAKDGEVASKLIFFPDPAEVTKRLIKGSIGPVSTFLLRSLT
jgi:hypothetical protein|eukprot:COSAG02_NODE_4335_length_5491_cov_14.768361_5_plen_78_part_00